MKMKLQKCLICNFMKSQKYFLLPFLHQTSFLIETARDFNKLQVDAMIRAKDHKMGNFFDPFGHHGLKRRTLL